MSSTVLISILDVKRFLSVPRLYPESPPGGTYVVPAVELPEHHRCCLTKQIKHNESNFVTRA